MPFGIAESEELEEPIEVEPPPAPSLDETSLSRRVAFTANDSFLPLD